ncbi:unnamed protein product [Amoebophrya sp. A120]|nr:unnamed protein product [Amoebophrya sp. A120]|eukprot:GSA120T00007485001.1
MTTPAAAPPASAGQQQQQPQQPAPAVPQPLPVTTSTAAAIAPPPPAVANTKDNQDDVGPLDSISNVGSSATASTSWQGIDFSLRPPKPQLACNVENYTYKPWYAWTREEVASDSSIKYFRRKIKGVDYGDDDDEDDEGGNTKHSTKITAVSSLETSHEIAREREKQEEELKVKQMLRRSSSISSFVNPIELFGRRNSSNQLVMPPSGAGDADKDKKDKKSAVKNDSSDGSVLKPSSATEQEKKDGQPANPSDDTTKSDSNDKKEEEFSDHPPTVVHFVLDVNSWSVETVEAREILHAKFTFHWYWCDERLIGYPPEKDLPKNVWRPEVMACAGVKVDEKYETMPKFQSGPHQKFNGELELSLVATLEPGYDMQKDIQRLRVFPFDSLRLDLSVSSHNLKRFDGVSEIQLRLDRKNPGGRKDKGHPHQHVNWICTNKNSGEYECVELRYGLGRLTWKEKRIPQFLFSFSLKRTANYYVLKGIIPLYCSMLFGAMNYFTEVNDLSTRLQSLLALFLTCFAIQWTLLERLPKFPFLTVLDNVAYSVVIALFLMGSGFCIAYYTCRERLVIEDSEIVCGSSTSGSASSPSIGQNSPSGGSTGQTTTSNACATANSQSGVMTTKTTKDFFVRFDLDKGELVDKISILVVAVYVLIYCIGYKFFYTVFFSKKTRNGGAYRAWRDGADLRNKYFKPIRAWCLKLDDAFFRGGVFLGMGRGQGRVAAQVDFIRRGPPPNAETGRVVRVHLSCVVPDKSTSRAALGIVLVVVG